MKIVISGYYGFGNAGDELILEAIVTELRSRRNDVDITVLSADPSGTAERCRVASIDRWDWRAVVRAVRKCDLLLSGGGGLFQDGTGSLSLYYYLGIIALARMSGKKVFVYGVGVNELNGCNKLVTAGILNRTSRITVRDAESRRLLLSWGCSTDKVELAADPVLLLDAQVREFSVEHPQVTLVLRPPCNGQWQIEQFARLADALQERLAARIVFIAFHVQQDRAFTHAVHRAMKRPAVVAEWSSVRDLCRTVGFSDLVISGRLHGLILAALYEVPFIGISEDPKIERFLRELRQKNIVRVAEIDFQALLQEAVDLWEKRNEFRSDLHALMPPFKARAKIMQDLLCQEEKH